MSVVFTATEAGFKEGLGGASNANGSEEYHYVLFGTQVDAQYPENSGAYFEHDAENSGAVNFVRAVVIGGKSAVFTLKNGESVEVKRGNLNAEHWAEFRRAVHIVFPPDIVSS